jgi:hypothetical protein
MSQGNQEVGFLGFFELFFLVVCGYLPKWMFYLPISCVYLPFYMFYLPKLAFYLPNGSSTAIGDKNYLTSVNGFPLYVNYSLKTSPIH